MEENYDTGLSRAFAYQFAALKLLQRAFKTVHDRLPPDVRARAFDGSPREQLNTARVLGHLCEKALQHFSEAELVVHRTDDEIREIRDSRAYEEWAPLSAEEIASKIADIEEVEDFLKEV